MIEPEIKAKISYNTYKSYSSACTAIFYHYVNANPSPDESVEKVMETEEIILSSEKEGNPLLGFSYTKTNNAAAGFFSFVLAPTQNWMQRIKPGDWVIVYLTNGNPSTPSNTGSSSSETPQARVIASSGGGGGEATYYWTDSQYQQFLQETENTGWSANILSLAAGFDAKVKAGQIVSNPLQSQNNKSSSGWHIRCIGTIDSVTMEEVINPDTGVRDIKFTVTGQDFGKVLDKYLVYINQWISSGFGSEALIKAILNKVNLNPGNFVLAILNAFLGKDTSLLEAVLPNQGQLFQWLIPSKLANRLNGAANLNSATDINSILLGGDVGTSSEWCRFLDVMDLTNINTNLPGWCNVLLLDVRNSLWLLLKENVNSIINELFCEMTDNGKPSIWLRTIPFTFKDYSGGSINSALSPRFLELPAVEIGGRDIMRINIGLNEQMRFTFMLLTSTQLDFESKDPKTSIPIIADAYPWVNKAGCKRYGLLAFENNTDYSLMQDGKWNPMLLREWNDLLKHWYKDNAYYETVRVTMIGNNLTRIGKRLDIVDGPSLMGLPAGSKRSYYIEDYTDTWTYPGSWTQTISCTRGVFVVNGKETLTYDKMPKDGSFLGTTILSRKDAR